MLSRIGQVTMSRPSVWRCTQAAGQRIQALAEAERRRAVRLPEKWEPPSRAAVKDQRMGVAMDGAIIFIREEGWKEVKIGTVFDVAVDSTLEEKSGEIEEVAHAVNTRHVAYLGGPDVLGDMVWAEARRCGWEQAQDTVVIGDGAPWIWNQSALHFGASRQLVDWYHAKQHLVEAARLLKREGSPAFSRWLNSRETRLFQGHAEGIAEELDKAAGQHPVHHDALSREANYFRSNQLRMNYLEMKEEEWPIGSGMVESAAKQLKARFHGPGMRWSRNGAENLLPIRAAVLSQRFDCIWHSAQNLPPT